MAKRAAIQPVKLTPDQIQAIESAVFGCVLGLMPDTYYLVAVTLDKQSGLWYLQVFVERPTHPDGISLQDCETISRLIDPALDELSTSGKIPAFKDLPYNLEVSSPGLFRILKTPREFTFYQGQTVCVQDVDVAASNKKNTVYINRQMGTLDSVNLETQIITLTLGTGGQAITRPLTAETEISLSPALHLAEPETEI